MSSVAAPYSWGAMPFTILVIDDDPLLLEMASELLASDGDRPLTASSGREGIAQTQEESTGMVLLGFDMKGLGGVFGHETLMYGPKSMDCTLRCTGTQMVDLGTAR